MGPSGHAQLRVARSAGELSTEHADAPAHAGNAVAPAVCRSDGPACSRAFVSASWTIRYETSDGTRWRYSWVYAAVCVAVRFSETSRTVVWISTSR